MKEQRLNLLKERKNLQVRITLIDNIIDSYQKLCNHKDDDGNSTIENVGHDSHKDYYECTICGMETSV